MALIDQCLYHLRDIKRLPEGESSTGHTALYTRIVLMLVMDVTVVVLLKYVTWSIYTETDEPLISQCFVSRGLVRQQVQ